MASLEAWFRQYRQHDDGVDDDTQQKFDFAPPLHDYLLGRTSAKDTAEKISSLLADSIAAACAASVTAADKKDEGKITDEGVVEDGNDDDDDDAFDEDMDDDDDSGGDDLEAALWDLWAIINDAAKQVPDVHDALLDLLAALRHLPDVKRNDGELLRVWDMVMWRDLPIWDADVREKYNFDDPAPGASNREQLRREEVNFNAFLAKACARSRVGTNTDSMSSTADADNSNDTDDPTAMPLYAVWALRRALEDAAWTDPDAASGIDPQYDAETKERLAHLATVHVLDGYVAPAAQWFFHAGRSIYDRCSEKAGDKNGDGTDGAAAVDEDGGVGEGVDEDEAAAGGGELWTGGAGFSRARWAFWKQRFAWVAEQRDLAADTRDVARAAADAMERIEREAAAAAAQA